MIAHNPLHGSGQAALPHPALALGDDAHAAQGIGMTDGRHRQPASDEAPHAIPKDAPFLAAPRQRAMPEPSYLEPKNPQRVLVPQRGQRGFPSKTLRAAGLLKPDFVVAGLTARCGDARPAPPRPAPKSLAAAPFPIFSQALRLKILAAGVVLSLAVSRGGIAPVRVAPLAQPFPLDGRALARRPVSRRDVARPEISVEP